MFDSTEQRKKCPVHLTDDQIRDHLEATSFHSLYVSQANIDQVRRFMEAEIRHRPRPAKTRTMIPGDYD
jgi:hypothetical protein